MAFGRDGSEIELSNLYLRNRTLVDALTQISEESTDESARQIAKKALKKSESISKKLIEEESA